MIYAQRETNADPKDCYCGEKGCPGRAANRFRQMLVYQFMAPFADLDSGFRPTETNLIVSVVSPLNALIRDQGMWFV